MSKNPPNPKQLNGDKKVPVQLVPPALTLGAAKALGEGASRYGPYNWRESNVEAMTYVGAILRHLYAYLDGEDIDPESPVGKRHLDGIAGSIAILLDATDGGFLIDNRPPKSAAPELTRAPFEKPEAKSAVRYRIEYRTSSEGKWKFDAYDELDVSRTRSELESRVEHHRRQFSKKWEFRIVEVPA